MWDTNERGNVIVHPLLGYDTVVIAGLGIGLRLQLATDPAAPQTVSLVVPAAMTVEQAQELIGHLQLAVNEALKPPADQARH